MKFWTNLEKKLWKFQITIISKGPFEEQQELEQEARAKEKKPAAITQSETVLQAPAAEELQQQRRTRGCAQQDLRGEELMQSKN